MIEVSFTTYELRFGVMVGIERQLEALRFHRVHKYEFQGNGWAVHIEGALAELAVAKATGRYWEALARNPDDLPGDVGRVQVRSTKHRNGALIVHPSDPDDAPFVLVVQYDEQTYHVVGWLYGREAKQQEFWTDKNGNGRFAFFVPQGRLRQINGRDRATAAQT